MAVLVLGMAATAHAQPPSARFGEVVPRDVREMYDRGLQYLAATQTENGDWPGGGSRTGPGGTGLGLMAFLASGEDPNFGLYSNHVRRALRSIITAQDANTGILGQSMYHHGFAMLGLAEAYGAVDERNLWPDRQGPAVDRPGPRAGRPRGDHLAEEEPARRLAVLARRHRRRHLGQRRGPGRPARGPQRRHRGARRVDRQGDRLLQVDDRPPPGRSPTPAAWAASATRLARISIATLVYAVARRKDLPEYKATLGLPQAAARTAAQGNTPNTRRYYQAQALFQGDVDAWEKWNKLLVRQLKQAQQPDGSFQGQFGPAFSTSMSLLALALNYRFLPIYER